MYSISRHLGTLHGGLRQVGGDNGGVKVAKRLLSFVSGGGSAVGIRGVHLRLPGTWRKMESGMVVNVKQVRNCRCYSQSAEKVVAKEEDAAAGEEQVEKKENNEVTSSSEKVSHQQDINLDAYDDEEQNPLYLTDEQIQELTDGDPELIKKIKYIQLEFSVLQQDGEMVPSQMKFKYWKELLPLSSRSKRKKFYIYLFKSEMKEASKLRKKLAEREERLKTYAENPWPSKEEDPYGMLYGLTRNTLFLRLYDATVNKFDHSRAANAMLHNPPIVLDCSYDGFMTHAEAKNCAKQLELLITENRQHKEPFNLYLCNARKETKTMQFLQRLIPTLEEDNYVVNVHEESFMDLFPRERLVYLTPHTRDDLDEYNEDDIYIIGAMVDKTDTRPHSLAKAKELRLRMRKLPLDQHLMWGLGNKALTLNHMLRIMLDLRYTRGDWKTALKHVPMRKLCRDFHPYPDQVQNAQESDASPMQQRDRKQKRSHVMEDYELLNRRRGFRRSNYSVPQRSSQAVQAPRIRSLFHDDN